MLKMKIPCNRCARCIAERKARWRISGDWTQLQHDFPGTYRALLDKLDWDKVAAIDEDLPSQGKTAPFAWFVLNTERQLPDIDKHELRFIALMVYVDHNYIYRTAMEAYDEHAHKLSSKPNRAERRKARSNNARQPQLEKPCPQ